MEKSYTIQYLGTLLVAQLTGNNKGIDVAQLRLANSGLLSPSANYAYRLNTTEKCVIEAIVAGKLVYFQELGLDFPCYLAITKNSDTHSRDAAYLLMFVNSKLELYKRVLVPFVISKERISCFDFKLLDGPRVMIFDKNCSMLYLCDYNDELCKKYEFASLGIDIPSSADYFIRTIESDGDGRALFFVQSTLNMDFITSAIQLSMDGTIKKLDPLQESDILLPPKEYWEILTTFGYFKMKSAIYNNIVMQSSSRKENFIAMATEMMQFLVSKGTHILLCQDIPFGDCCSIEKIEVPNYDTLFLLTSKCSECCVVSWKQRKVIKHWTEVHDTFVGDFCRSGHNQILILLSNASSQSVIKFSLTDFLCCKKGLEDANTDRKQNTEIQRSLQAVKTALTNNVQAMTLKVEEKQAVFNRKNELIMETWLNMQRMSLGLDACEKRSSINLVPLFHSETNDCQTINGQDSNKPDSNPLKVLEQQQFMESDRLVVSCKVLNNSNKQLSNLNLQILLKDCLSQSYVASCSNQNLNSEMVCAGLAREPLPSAAPGDVFTLTARTNMPNLRPDQSIDAPLIVEWNQNDVKHSFSCCVGKATLDLKAYSDALYFPEEAILNDLLQSVQVEVISSQHNLSSFVDRVKSVFKKLRCEVIMERMHCDSKHFLGENQGRVWIFLSKSGMMAAIDIEARSIFDATQYFSVLQSELPDGCEISLPWRKQQELITAFASCMTKELSLRKKMCASEEVDEQDRSDMEIDMPDESGEIRPGAKEAVTRIRQQFRHKRKLADMLMENGGNFGKERCVKIDSKLYEEYFRAVESTNNAGELLAKIYMTNEK